MRYFAILIVTILLSSCAFSMGSPRPPVERTCGQFSTWELETKPCILRLNDDDTVTRLCHGDLGYPADLTGVTIQRMNCERDYQDTLVRSCKRWRK